MPLIGYLILFNEHVVTALHLDNSLSGGITDNFLISRLRLLYFGLFATGLGAIFFTIFCPPKIKQYADAIEFAERELHFLPLPYFNSLLRDLPRLRNPVYRDIDTDEYADRLATHDGTDLNTVKNQIIVEWYWSQSHRYPIARWAAFFFFTMGFVLLFYPSIETLIRIIYNTF
jgi:hypothetical protein